jgi:hypothetical protein
MGDMLQGGGNRWLGMVFGMTVRYPWTTEGIPCDPRPVWKIWDDFRIQDAKMIGFWEKNCPVKCNLPEVKATAYLNKDRVLISIGNFSDSVKNIKLSLDWHALGISPENCRFYAPAIENFQPTRSFNPKETIPVAARQGWLIYLENDR